MVTFLLREDTVEIYEPLVRNSGIVGRKLLPRVCVKNLDTGDYFRPQDLEVRHIMAITRQHFELIEATEYTMSYMEADLEISHGLSKACDSQSGRRKDITSMAC
jgi:hypothetical protein